MSAPPPGMLPYRLLTGADDAAFGERISEAPALGYVLHGSPAATSNAQHVIAGQAVVWRVGPSRRPDGDGEGTRFPTNVT